MSNADVKLTAYATRVCATVNLNGYIMHICHDLSAPPGHTRVRRHAPYKCEVTVAQASDLLASAKRCSKTFDPSKLWMREFGGDYAELDFIERSLKKLCDK